MRYAFRLIDLNAKDGNQKEVRRCDTLSLQSARHKSDRFETYETKLSADGRTVTSMKASDANVQVLEVWDSGKGTVGRICLEKDERVTTFVQGRLLNKNCLFACIRGINRTN